MKDKMRLAIFVSGSGTTMAAILQACQTGELTGIEPAIVVASKSDIGAIDKALDMGLPSERIFIRDSTAHVSDEAFGEEILTTCLAHNVNLIGQYGWMPKMPLNVVKEFAGRSVNQHPAPAPWFGGRGMYGLRAHAAVLKFAELVRERRQRPFDYTRVIAQRVDASYDKGEVLDALPVPIHLEDTPEILAARALPVQWWVQIRALQNFADGREDKCTYYYANPFVEPGEEDMVQEAKQFAMQQYH